jgi:hypothetical protein
MFCATLIKKEHNNSSFCKWHGKYRLDLCLLSLTTCAFANSSAIKEEQKYLSFLFLSTGSLNMQQNMPK